MRSRRLPNFLLAALCLGASVAPAFAQGAALPADTLDAEAFGNQLFQQVIDAHAERLRTLTDYTIVTSAFTAYHRITVPGDSAYPVVERAYTLTNPYFFEPFVEAVSGSVYDLVLSETNAMEDDTTGFAVTYRGTRPLDDGTVHVFDMTGASFSLGPGTDHGVMTIWLDETTPILRRLEVQALDSTGAAIGMRIEQLGQWARKPLPLPEVYRLHLTNLPKVFDAETRADFEAGFAQVQSDLEPLNEDEQRAYWEAQPPMQWVLYLMATNETVTFTAEVREVRINGGVPDDVFQPADETDAEEDTPDTDVAP